MNIAVKFPPVKQLEMKPVSIFAPKARTCPHNGDCPTEELCNSYGECKLDHTSVRGPDLDKLAAELSRKPLDDIAAALRALTYGEMMTLAAGIWYARSEEEELTDENLPGVLHRWATGQERK